MLYVQSFFHKHDGSKPARGEVVAEGIVPRGTVWGQEAPMVVELHTSTGGFKTCLYVVEQFPKIRQSLG